MVRIALRLLAVVALGLFAAVIGRSFLMGEPTEDEVAAPPSNAVEIRVAAVDLEIGTFVDAPEIPFEWWQGDIPEDAIREDDNQAPDVLGAVVIEVVPAGEPLRRSSLLLPGQEGFLAAVLQPGMRAVSVPVNAVSGNAGHIFPGDRVDLLLTQSLRGSDFGEEPTQQWATETILQDVRVIAVDQDVRNDLTQRGASQVARTITLEVTPRDAQAVALASGLGQLSLSLRSMLVAEPVERGPDTGRAGAVAAANATDGTVEAEGPTWAGDVSAVLRAAAGRPTLAPDAPPPPPRTMRVMRGNTAEIIEP